MDPRRLLTGAGAALALPLLLAACAASRPDLPSPVPDPVAVLAIALNKSETASPGEPPDAAAPPFEVPDHPGTIAFSDLDAATAGPVLEGQAALAAANAAARSRSRSDAFVGGVQVFSWSPGRVYEIWTAPLRVTTLTLPPGEAVTALAAGDTVRWQIARSSSGGGADAAAEGALTHVLIKPLEAGLETNLVLTTTARVYLLHLRSARAADGFNTAVAWDLPARPSQEAPAPVDLSPAMPEGALHAAYRIRPDGRTPDWSPVAVVDDGTRTFITLGPGARRRESPVLFVLSASGDRELTNYRQVEGVLIVDRLFERAELRLGDRRPQIVRVTRLETDR